MTLLMIPLTPKGGRLLEASEEQEKARTRPIDGPYVEMAEEVRRLLGFYSENPHRYLASRVASRKTGVNHATITTMIRGDRPSYETVLKFARGMGGDAARLLKLAGYEAPEEDAYSLPSAVRHVIREKGYDEQQFSNEDLAILESDLFALIEKHVEEKQRARGEIE